MHESALAQSRRAQDAFASSLHLYKVSVEIRRLVALNRRSGGMPAGTRDGLMPVVSPPSPPLRASTSSSRADWIRAIVVKPFVSSLVGSQKASRGGPPTSGTDTIRPNAAARVSPLPGTHPDASGATFRRQWTIDFIRSCWSISLAPQKDQGEHEE